MPIRVGLPPLLLPSLYTLDTTINLILRRLPALLFLLLLRPRLQLALRQLGVGRGSALRERIFVSEKSSLHTLLKRWRQDVPDGLLELRHEGQQRVVGSHRITTHLRRDP